MASTISWEAWLPTSWNSGIDTYWIPVHGCSATPGFFGSTSDMISLVSAANSPPASLYSGTSQIDSRVPGGVRAQPSSEPTRFRYSFEVAQRTNCQAASWLSLSALIPRFHDHSQPESVVSLTGART